MLGVEVRLSESSFVIKLDAISPEVERAQRMAELKDVAEYRARRLKAYQEWSDPIKRAQIQAKHAEELKQARESWDRQVAQDAKKLEMHMPKVSFADRIMVRVIERPKVKPSLWQRF